MLLVIFFYILFAIQICYYIYYNRYFNKYTPYDINYLPAISVIICAKNEAENLKEFIPLIATQKYDKFEIIVVNDNSTDNTLTVLQELKQQYQNIEILTISEKIGNGKKYLIEKAVAIAKYDVLAFIDADCFPASGNWLNNMVTHLANYEIVLGVSPILYKKEYHHTVNIDMQQYETMQTYLQYIALANAQKPYMAVGRNMMIKKSCYQKLKWTKEEYFLASGDDDLMIQKLTTSSNTNTCSTLDEAFTYTAPKATYKKWCAQKLRHYTTGTKYKFKHQFILGIFLWSKFCFHTIFFLILILELKVYISVIIITYFIYHLIITHILKNIDNYYNKTIPFYKIIFLDFITVTNIIFLGLYSNILHKKTKWT
jgi:glycosyltransferase involved in cell wall biosynthesis